MCHFGQCHSQGKASLDIANLRGDTPLKMLQVNSGSIWIGSKVMERIREESQSSQRKNFFVKLTLDKVSTPFGPKRHENQS